MRQVYLAGPILGLTYDACTDWRQNVIKQLEQHGIKGVSPMRWKEELKNEPLLQDNYTGILTSQKAIVTRDRFDCMNSDAILVNLLGAKRVSIGTMIEYGWGDSFRKPIITVIEKEGNIHDHAFVRELSGYRVENLEQGLSVVRAILA